MTPCENIRIIGITNDVNELNRAYNETVLEAERLAIEGAFDGCGTSVTEVLSTLSHLANYNIVRIANMAFEDFESSGRTDNSRLVVIGACRDAIKEHEDAETERGLLDNLCDELFIN